MSKLTLTQKAFVDEEGVLKLSDHRRSQMKSKLRYFAKKNVTITIDEDLDPPSTEQRGYYHGVILPIWKQLLIQQSKDNMLVTVDMLHQLAKKMFLPPIEILINSESGEIVTLDASTKKGKCSKEMYSTLIEGMIKFLVEEYDEVIPEADKQTKIEFKNYLSGKKTII